MSPPNRDSAFDVSSKADVEKGVVLSKSDSAADLAANPDHDPAKAVMYQDKMADQNAPQRSVKLDKSQRMFWGIGVAVTAGIVGSLFSPGFNVVTNDAFHTLAPGVEPLTVYTGYVTLHICAGKVELGSGLDTAVPGIGCERVYVTRRHAHDCLV